MMSPDFSRRSGAAEWMDDPAADPDVLAACLADLAVVNRVTLAHAPTLRFLARATRGWARGRTISVLDVASGHGDMLRAIASWARRRGLAARLTGIDLSPASAPAARAATPRTMPIAYETADVFAYRPTPAPDFIVSSLFTHHLADAEVVAFLRWMEANAAHGWFVNDLHRHPVPYHGFQLLSTLAGWHPFVRHDGPVSIARAFSPADWAALLRQAEVPASVRWRLPFRLCVSRLRPS